MTVLPRTPDELQTAPAFATLPALSACIEAFVSALGVAHPHLCSSSRPPASDRETVALLLHMYFDQCQELLAQYDYLTFDAIGWDCPEPGDDDATPDDTRDEDDIPF